MSRPIRSIVVEYEYEFVWILFLFILGRVDASFKVMTFRAASDEGCAGGADKDLVVGANAWQVGEYAIKISRAAPNDLIMMRYSKDKTQDWTLFGWTILG